MELTNRIARELDLWRESEKRLEKIFGAGVTETPEFKREKLRHFQDLAVKYTGHMNPEERIALLMVDADRKKLLKELYPNFLVRYFHQVRKGINRLIDNERGPETERRNLEVLKKQVARAGFLNIEDKLEGLTKRGEPSFDVPVSYYVDPSRKMDFVLSFENEGDGRYRFEKYYAVLTNTIGSTTEKKSQTFWVDDGINPRQAQNLLSGRAVRHGSEWLQLDFDDRDHKGDFVFKRFPENYFDLKGALEKIANQNPQISLSSSFTRQALMELSEGGQPEILIQANGRQTKVRIGINPQFRTLDLYKAGKVVSISELLGKAGPQIKPLQGVGNNPRNRKKARLI